MRKLLLLFLLLATPAWATVTTLQPDNGIDNLIKGGDQNANYGIYTRFYLGSRSGANNGRGLLKFDVSSIPSNATITDATLSLYFFDNGASALDEVIQLYRITTNWNEGDNNATTTDDGESDWVDAIQATTTWTTAGGDYNGTSNGAFPALDAADGYGFKDCTINAAGIATIQGWVNETVSNFGWILIHNDELNNAHDIDFYNSDFGDSGTDPKLAVTYTTPSAGGGMKVLILN